MPSRKQHLASDREHFGEEFPAVHQILDQFAHYPDMKFLREHRKFLHHEEGIAYITDRFGKEAGAAARQHVIDDCGWVPLALDYYAGVVDNYGVLRKDLR